MKEIKALELQEDGNRLFHGICDRQINEFAAGWMQDDCMRGEIGCSTTAR